MPITLYSPNLGADGVTEYIRAVICKEVPQFPDFKIAVLPGDVLARKKEMEALRLSPFPKVNLFLVERFRMPHPKTDGKSVVVYKTTIRLGTKAYVATCYTIWTGDVACGTIDLTEKSTKEIARHVDKATPVGVWESLLQAEKLKKFRFS